MTARNTYATLAEFKAYRTARGQTATTDAADDVVLDGILEDVSRFIDDETGRFFYPRIETKNYSVPDCSELDFGADVLEIVSLTNGDSSSISASDYNLLPKNESTKYGMKLKQSSSIAFEAESDGDSDFVIALNAVFGFHLRYADAWKAVGTLGAAITDTATLAFTMTAGHTLAVGKIAKIDNELYIVDTVSTNTITPLKRGDNGSTAATHLNGTTVYTWQPMEQLKSAVLETAERASKRRFGQTQGNDSIVSPAGFVLPPKDIPAMALKFIQKYQRLV